MMWAGFKRGWTDAQKGRPNDAMRFKGKYAEGYFEGYMAGREALVTGDSVEEVWQRVRKDG